MNLAARIRIRGTMLRCRLGKLRDLWQGARCLPLPQVFRRHCVPWQRTVARRRGRNGRVDAMELGGLDVPLAVLVLGA
jgi:hypothetical protein